jgi:hypothetical protein
VKLECPDTKLVTYPVKKFLLLMMMILVVVVAAAVAAVAVAVVVTCWWRCRQHMLYELKFAVPLQLGGVDALLPLGAVAAGP